MTFILPLLIATILGFLAGMGVGGGSLLLLWLTQVVMLEQAQAKILNLLFYLPAAIAATLFRIKHHTIDKRIAAPGLLAGCFSAFLLSVFSRRLDLELAKKLLGGLLIMVGIREIFYRRRNAR